MSTCFLLLFTAVLVSAGFLLDHGAIITDFIALWLDFVEFSRARKTTTCWVLLNFVVVAEVSFVGCC